MNKEQKVKIKAIHFVGIKGVGMTPLAIIAKEAGFIVTGSDIAQGFITDEILQKAGITPFVGFSKNNVCNVDYVVTTGAHGGYDNIEVQEAKKLHIPVVTQGEAVGIFMQGEFLGKDMQKGISILGTHGKTTTTAMIATLLRDCEYDPSWIVGTSTIASLGMSGHFGKGDYFVAEADEYATEPIYNKKTKFLWQHPSFAVITNIEHDHPDLYPTIKDVVMAFQSFVDSLPKDAKLVAYGDDPRIKQIISSTKVSVTTYGLSMENDYAIIPQKQSNGKLSFKLLHNKKFSEIYTLSVMGSHNILNAAATAIIGIKIGIASHQIAKGLLHFSGTKRRLEYIGQLKNGALLYDDYAHHPTEIQATLGALRQQFPKKKILCIFQPHTFSRTKLLFDQFSLSFSKADNVIVAKIYPSQRESFDNSISSAMLAEAISKHGKTALFFQNLSDVIQYILSQKYNNNVVIITMGAGDVYTIAKEILEHESAPHK